VLLATIWSSSIYYYFL